MTELVKGLAVLGELTPRSIDAIASYGERLSSYIVSLAFEHFDAAEAAMTLCSRRAMRPAATMGAFYRAMLEALIEAGWRDPRARVSLSKGRKLWLVLRHGLI